MNLIHDTKDHIRHFTVTGYVINNANTKLLLIHHKKLAKWMPPGGHIEKNEVPHEAAIREILEETGVEVTLVDAGDPDLELKGTIDVQIPRPYALCYQLIPAGKDPEHIHMDMIYIFKAREESLLTAQLAEIHAVEWRSKDAILQASDVFDSVKGFAKLYMKP